VCWRREDDNFEDISENFELNNTVFSSIEKIRTIHILNLQEETNKKFLGQSKKSHQMSVKKGFRTGFKNGFNICVSLFVYGISFFYCATVIANQLADRCTSNCATGGALCSVFFSFIIAANALYSMHGPLSDIYNARVMVAAAELDQSSDVFTKPLLDSSSSAKSNNKKQNQSLKQRGRETAEKEMCIEDLYSSRPDGDLWDLLNKSPVPSSRARTFSVSDNDNQDGHLSGHRGAYAVSPLSAGSARGRLRNKGVVMENEVTNVMWTGDEEKDSYRAHTVDRNLNMMVNTLSGAAVFKALTEESEVTPRSSFQGPAGGTEGAAAGTGMGVSDNMNYTPSSTPLDSRSRANSDTPLFELVNPDNVPAPYPYPSSAVSSSQSYIAKGALSARTPETRRSSQSQSPRPYEHRTPRPSHEMQLVSSDDPHDLPAGEEEEDIMDLDHGLKFRVQRLLAANLWSLAPGLLGAAMVSAWDTE
jgi:ABC transporter transmembrane region